MFFGILDLVIEPLDTMAHGAIRSECEEDGPCGGCQDDPCGGCW